VKNNGPFFTSDTCQFHASDRIAYIYFSAISLLLATLSDTRQFALAASLSLLSHLTLNYQMCSFPRVNLSTDIATLQHIGLH